MVLSNLSPTTGLQQRDAGIRGQARRKGVQGEQSDISVQWNVLMWLLARTLSPLKPKLLGQQNAGLWKQKAKLLW